MLGQVTHVLNTVFVKFTGSECEDVSAKLALLSLQHPAGMAIKEEFESVKRLYYGYDSVPAFPELLSWDIGRFGGKTSFIVDRIQGRSIEVREVVRVMPDGASRRRNDCCAGDSETWSICPGCKVCFCEACFCHKGWYQRQRCTCWMSVVGWPFQWGVAGRFLPRRMSHVA
jgi:hypothetical protein